ncbi:MAG: hypothetical protein GTO63_04565 [Anaerolineae bacterium]|nr:hypothetical protein [Anaerolineae bacterium]NIN94274.1 hypothetical protein [Anaerolineae bacterium]NIQ77342.1 hypothetical protein [Anaerolineae bacterium]
MIERLAAKYRPTWHGALLIGIFVAAVVLLTRDINAPFVRQGSYDEIIYTLHARAYDRYGLTETRLALVFPPGDPAAPLGEQAHNPTRSVLLTVLLTFVYKLLGYHESAGRLIGITSTLVSLLALYYLVKQLWTKRVAAIAVVAMAFTPSVVIFGRETWTVPPQMACWLVAIWLYVRWLQTEETSNLRGMTVSLTLGILFSPWSGWLLPPLIALHGLIFAARHRWRILAWSLGALLAASAVFAAHFVWLGPLVWHDLLERIALRVGVSGIDVSPSAMAWLTKVAWRFSGWDTPIAILIGVAVLVGVILRAIKHRKLALPDQILLLLAAFGMAIILFFPQLAWTHHYVSLFIVPYLAVASALIIDALIARALQSKAALATIVTLSLGWIVWATVMINVQSQYHLKELDIFAHLDQSLRPSDRVLVAGPVPFTFQFYFEHPWIRVGIDDDQWDQLGDSRRYALGLIFFYPGSPVESPAASRASPHPGGRVDTDPPLSPSFFVVQLDEADRPMDDLVSELNSIPERSPPNPLETFVQETRKQVEIQLGIRTRPD